MSPRQSTNRRASRRPAALLIDLDETVLTFDSASPEAWSGVLRDFESRLDGLGESRALDTILAVERAFWSDPDRHRRGRLDFEWAWRQTSSGALRKLGIADEALAGEMADSYTARRRELVTPLPGALGALGALRDSGLAMALVTNGNAEWQRWKIDKFEVDQYFDAIANEGQLGFGKPDPRIFRYALERLNVPASEAWMVGDNLRFDIAGGRDAGLFTVWVDGEREGLPDDPPALPDRSIASLAELPKLLP